MATALILPLGGSEAGKWLSVIRQVADEASRSEPHITVRYPIRRIDRQVLASTHDEKISSAVVTGPGCFGDTQGKKSVVYLGCESEELESFSYKPDYPDSEFHLTLNERPQSVFSQRLYERLQAKPWNLRINFSPPVRLEEIVVGDGGSSRKRRERFSQQVLDAIEALDGRYSSRSLADLTDDERLDVIDLAIERMHIVLESLNGDPPTPSIRYLDSAPIADVGGTLWRGVPVASPASPNPGEKLPGQEARRGNLVLTPPELVEEMVGYGVEALGRGEIHFGDPAFGNGIFFAVLTRLTRGNRRIASASAVEINEDRALLAAKRWGRRGLQVLVGNFLTAIPEESWSFVLANPPYVRSQAIDDSVRNHARDQIRRSVGMEVPKRANMFVYFLLRSHDWMVSGGIAAWLIPADFMETSYAAVLREYLVTRVELLRVHAYDPNEFHFENVRVAPAVVIFRKRPSRDSGEIVMSRGGSMHDPKYERRILVSDLRQEVNWRLVPSGLSRARHSKPDLVSLGDLFTIRRGIATGANSFFVIDEERLVKYELEADELRPLLPRPRFLPLSGVVEATHDGLPKVQPRLFLIDSDDDLTTLSKRAPRLAEYLRSAPSWVLNGHLVKQRNPFYKQERRNTSRLIVSNMGQFTADGKPPVRFFLNLSRATVLNNYLVLYPKSSASTSLDLTNAKKLFALLGNIDPEEFLIWGKEYSGGMYKVEPRDLARVRLQASRRAVRALLDQPDRLFIPRL